MRAKIRNTELYFDVDGMGLIPDGDRMTERPTLFLLHGGPGGDHSGFKTSSAALRDTAQLVYVDYRGSGRSAAGDPATYTLDNNIDDLDALREHLGLNRISVLGSSYGGMVAQGYALRYPERVANLILVCTAPSFRFMEDAQQIVRERGTPDQIRVCQRLWDGNFETMDQLEEYYRLMGPMYSTTFKPEDFENGWKRGIRSFVALNRGFGDFLRKFDYIDRLHQIACPTLVLAAEHDWICPPKHGQLIARKIPRAQFKLFAKSGHSLASDEPLAYQQAIRGFLTYAAP